MQKIMYIFHLFSSFSNRAIPKLCLLMSEGKELCSLAAATAILWNMADVTCLDTWCQTTATIILSHDTEKLPRPKNKYIISTLFILSDIN